MKAIKKLFTKKETKETIPLESGDSPLFIYNENYVPPGTSLLNENYSPPGSEWLPTPRRLGESLSNIILTQETRILDTAGRPIGDIHAGSGENHQLTANNSTWDDIYLTPPVSHTTSSSTIYRNHVSDKEVVEPLLSGRPW